MRSPNERERPQRQVATRDRRGAPRLAGRTAAITGSAGGQGREAALLFSSEGARIVACDIDPDGANETERAVRDAGGWIESLAPVDLSHEPEVARFVAFAARVGGFDILYNNAASTRPGALAVVTEEDVDFCVRNEVSLLVFAAKHARGVLAARGGGVIINIASVAGIVGSGLPGNVAGTLVHNVFKAAVIRLSTHLAVELAPDRIRVNCISPGIIETPGTQPLLGGKAASVRARFIAQLLVPRIGTPRDVAAAALFLASDEASYITGVNLVVDGGWVASGGAGLPDPEFQRTLAETVPAFLDGTSWRTALDRSAPERHE